VRDNHLGAALASMGVGELGPRFIGPLGRTRQQRLKRFGIVRKGRDDGFPAPDEITKARPN